MSVRPSIAGFDLAQFRKLFGSRDPAVIADCSAQLDEIAEEIADEEPAEADEYREQVVAILKRAVNEGVPFAELEIEDSFHMDVVSALSQYQQSFQNVGSNGWKMQAFWTFHKEYRARLDLEARSLLSFLSDGRPLFAPRTEADGLYAYLDFHEVTLLLVALRSLQQQCPELVGPGCLSGFVDTLIGWLDQIAGSGQDLWMLAY